MGSDIVELFLAVEEGFQVQIPDDDAGDCETVGQLHDLVISRLQAQDHEESWNDLCDVIAKETGIAQKKITPQSRFVDDFRLD